LGHAEAGPIGIGLWRGEYLAGQHTLTIKAGTIKAGTINADTIKAGRVPTVFVPTDEARMAGTRPAMMVRVCWPNNSPPTACLRAMGQRPGLP
jgi:hypothetical protein